jgi:uncharacterized protein (TIGR02145 family)
MKPVLTSILFALAIILKAQTVAIGAQVWLTKNLYTTTFSNGDPIPQAISFDEWKRSEFTHRPAWCYYKNDRVNGVEYGVLYNYYAVVDPRGLCPAGWHVPSVEEWFVLTNALGGGWTAPHTMKSTSLWNGDNSSGFEGLPGGHRDGTGMFYGIGCEGSWWSSSADGALWATVFPLVSLPTKVSWYTEYKHNGHSVRCLKD